MVSRWMVGGLIKKVEVKVISLQVFTAQSCISIHFLHFFLVYISCMSGTSECKCFKCCHIPFLLSKNKGFQTLLDGLH